MPTSRYFDVAEPVDGSEREVRRVREALTVEREHLLAIERGEALAGQRLCGVVVRRIQLRHFFREHLSR